MNNNNDQVINKFFNLLLIYGSYNGFKVGNDRCDMYKTAYVSIIVLKIYIENY